MKPRYRLTAFVLLIAFMLLAAVYFRVIAQTQAVKGTLVGDFPPANTTPIVTGFNKGALIIENLPMQEKSVAAAKDDKKVTSVDFKPGDAAQLSKLRIQIDQLNSALKLVGNIDYPAQVLRAAGEQVNRQMAQILESYHCDGCNIRSDDHDNWVGMDAPKKP